MTALGIPRTALIPLDRTRMPVDDRLVTLAPGMAVLVGTRTGRRRIIQYVPAPLLRRRQESLTEE